MGTLRFDGVLVLACVAGLVGCGAAPDGDELSGEEEESVDTRDDAISAAPPPCQNGMTTKVVEVDAPWAITACTVSQLPDLMSYVAATDTKVHKFLKFKLDGHGTIQCTPYTKPDGSTAFCADVVDRYHDGTSLTTQKEGAPFSMNWFIAYTNDDHVPLSSEVAYWDGLLASPALVAAPVSLQLAAYITTKLILMPMPTGAPPAQMRNLRLFKFDPRNCGGCGFYGGPNKNHVFDPADLAVWYPSFSAWNCTFQQGPAQPASAWYPLNQDECNDEEIYRNTHR